MLRRYLFGGPEFKVNGTNFYQFPVFSQDLVRYGEDTLSMLWPIHVLQVSGSIFHLLAPQTLVINAVNWKTKTPAYDMSLWNH